jgi:regulator of sirC expression with transglutaminase-like and TPR domain
MLEKVLNKKELKALVSLLEDEDFEVIKHVEDRILSIGNEVIPFLEKEWEESFNPNAQRKIEDLIHTLQFDHLKFRLQEWTKNGGHDLLEGVWIVATYQYPDLELGFLKKEIEQLYYEVWLEYKKDLHPFDQVKLINNAIFEKLKFRANSKNFHAPGNSMINVVLETKRGNPISLCILYILIAQKLELPVHGVNLPNLFMCTYKTKEHQFYINAFNKGLIFSKSDIENYVQQLHLNPVDLFFEPCQNEDIIKRILRNLIISFDKIADHQKSDEIKQLLKAIDGDHDLNQDH